MVNGKSKKDQEGKEKSETRNGLLKKMTPLTPQELRIGNYIKKPNGSDEGQLIIVEDIQKDCVNIDDVACYGAPPSCWFEKDGYGREGAIEGIPLTEEWLLKLGAKEVEDDFVFAYENRYQVIARCDDEGNWFAYQRMDIGMPYEMLCDFNNFQLEYVHQLQNLFFCLCGEELILK